MPADPKKGQRVAEEGQTGMQGNRLSRDGTCFHSEKSQSQADNKDTNDRTESLGVVDRHLSDFGMNVINGFFDG